MATTPQIRPVARSGARVGTQIPMSPLAGLYDFVAALWRLVRPVPVPITRACTVATKDGATARGVLYRQTHEHVLVARCEVIEPEGKTWTPVDGDLLIYRDNVRYIQLL